MQIKFKICKKSRTWAEKWQNLQAFCQVVVEPLATVVFRAACDRIPRAACDWARLVFSQAGLSSSKEEPLNGVISLQAKIKNRGRLPPCEDTRHSRSQAIHTYAKDKRMKSKIGVTRLVRTQGAPGRKQLPVASNSCLYKR